MRINLFGAPSSGKSTVASFLYSAFKKKGYNIELVREYMKNWAYEGKKATGFFQDYVQSKQLYKEYRLLASKKVDHVITDSPVLLNAFYSIYYDCPCKTSNYQKAIEFEKAFPSINILLMRGLIRFKDDEGRLHSEQESLQIHNKLEEFLQFLKYSLIEREEGIIQLYKLKEEKYVKFYAEQDTAILDYVKANLDKLDKTE